MHRPENEPRGGIVAIIGPPNAGKSTLLNSFVGHKLAIVTPKPQTTRNQISGILSRPGLQIVFLDTPGIHRPDSTMNSLMVQVAWQALAGADVALLVCDGYLAVTTPGRFQAQMERISSRMENLPVPLILTVNKTDLVKNKSDLIPVIHRLSSVFPGAEIIPVSAARGENIDHLLHHVVSYLPHSPPVYPHDQLSTLPVRFLASEIIREKLFLTLDRELPYSLAVAIEHWEESHDQDLVTIHALIYVPKASHKGIVIGRGGRLLKTVGQQARPELEEVLEMRVNLQMWVKVKPKWTEDENFVLQFWPEFGR
ncbi:MAG: GTPase Era [Desulfovermiculus sp.]|nr:GTPase Era [Desulfovermiculus sp.]